jgi:hypothetical protein
MSHLAGDGQSEGGRLDFDRRVRIEFHGSTISSDGGLLLYRELDDVMGLHELIGEHLVDTRTGHNLLHSIVALSRQSIFGRLAGYEDVNDADYLAIDPVMRQIVGGRAVDHQAASASQMGRFETEVLTTPENLVALPDMPGRWIDRHHAAKPLKWITLDMDNSVSRSTARRKAPPGTATSTVPATTRCSCSISSATWNAASSAPATCTAPTAGRRFWVR